MLADVASGRADSRSSIAGAGSGRTADAGDRHGRAVGIELAPFAAPRALVRLTIACADIEYPFRSVIRLAVSCGPAVVEPEMAAVRGWRACGRRA